MSRSTLALAIGLAVACGDDNGGASDTGDAADNVADTADITDDAADTADTAGDTSNGDGDVTPETCPFDATTRSRVEVLIQAAIADAGWIIGGTHGQGVFASRAFGCAIPFTEEAMLYAVTLAEACTEAKVFEPYCEEPEPGVPGSLSRCSVLECLAAGELQARAWLEDLPQSLPSGDGDLLVRVLDARTITKELPAGPFDVSWTNVLELTFADGLALAIASTGTGHVEEGTDAQVALLAVRIDMEARALLIDIISDAEGVPSGTALVAGEEVFTLAGTVFSWSAACAGP